MGDVTPNMGIFIPSSGEDLYRASYAGGQNNIDLHQHTGAPDGGLPIGSDGLQDEAITPDKLSLQVRQAANYIANLGMSYSNGVFAVTSADGSALSSTNRAYVTFQNKLNAGQLITITRSANQSFDDAASGMSQIAGNLFGRASGVDSSQDVQFYLYAVMNDAQNAMQMMICPVPCQAVSPPPTKIGTPSNPIADTEDSFFSLGDITVGDYDGNPAVELGCFRMRKTGGAANDWTVQGLTTGDGIGGCSCNNDEIDVPGFPKSPGWQNLGFTLQSGFFQVTDAEGNPLTPTNKASVTLASNVTSCTLVTVDISGNLGFRDSSNISGSDIAGNLFGTQDDNTAPGSPRGWINDMPWFLYAVLNDSGDGVGFALSRNPAANIAPVTGDSGTIGLATADTQLGFYYLARDSSGNSIIPTATPGGTAADYVALFDGNPCLCLGSFRVRKVVSTANDWTVQALSFTDGDGIAKYHSESIFTLPAGVNGAALGTYVFEAAGTEPTWTTNGATYSIQKNGYCHFKASLTNANVPGVGADVLQIITPYQLSETLVWGFGVFTDSSGSNARVFTSWDALAGDAKYNEIYVSGAGVALTFDDIDASDSLQSDIWLKCF